MESVSVFRYTGRFFQVGSAYVVDISKYRDIGSVFSVFHFASKSATYVHMRILKFCFRVSPRYTPPYPRVLPCNLLVLRQSVYSVRINIKEPQNWARGPAPWSRGVGDPLKTSHPHMCCTSNLVVLRQRVYAEIEENVQNWERWPVGPAPSLIVMAWLTLRLSLRVLCRIWSFF